MNFSKIRILEKGDGLVYTDIKHAKRALAEAQISMLLKYGDYGGEITKDEWSKCSTSDYHDIYMNVFNIIYVGLCDRYSFLAFHTKQQAEEFLENNMRLVKDYFMLD